MNRLTLICVCVSCLVCLIIGFVVGWGLGVGELYKPYQVGYMGVYP